MINVERNERMAANMKCWDGIIGDVSRNRLLGGLQDCDKEIVLSEAHWEFIQRHNLDAFPHRGQAINFAEICIQHSLKNESSQLTKFYGTKIYQDAETKREFAQIRKFFGPQKGKSEKMERQFAQIRKFFGDKKTKGNEEKREFAQSLISIGPKMVQDDEKTQREFAQIFSAYQHIMVQDDEVSWTIQISPSTSAIPPLEEIAAPEPAQEDPRIAAFEEISPIAAQIYLCYSEGYSRLETAKIMSVSPSQILYDLKKAGHEANRQRNQPALFRIPVSEIRKKSVKKLGRPTKAAQAAATQQQQTSMF